MGLVLGVLFTTGFYIGCKKLSFLSQTIAPGGAVKYEVDTGVRPAIQQAGAFGESTGSKNGGVIG